MVTSSSSREPTPQTQCIGKHDCPGLSFASNEMKMIVAYLIHKYDSRLHQIARAYYLRSTTGLKPEHKYHGEEERRKVLRIMVVSSHERPLMSGVSQDQAQAHMVVTMAANWICRQEFHVDCC